MRRYVFYALLLIIVLTIVVWAIDQYTPILPSEVHNSRIGVLLFAILMIVSAILGSLKDVTEFIQGVFGDDVDSSISSIDKQVRQVWSIAIKKAIRQLKVQRSNHALFLSNERFKLEEVQVEENKAVLIITVAPKLPLLFAFLGLRSMMELAGWSQLTEAKYKLTIDRGGDILQIKLIEESTLRNIMSLKQSSYGKQQLVLKEVKEPVTEITSNGLKISVTFIIDNRGLRKKIHPKVEYKIAKLRGGKFEESLISSPTDWIIELNPKTIHPVTFTQTFDDVKIVLLKDPPNKISVKLFPVNN